MFDIGFLEILVVLVIALLVIGPERMPELARKIGQFMGKMRRFVNSMKEEGQVQETLREIKDSMNLEEEKTNIQNLSKEFQDSLDFNEVNLDELKRPFGGENQPEQNSVNQFNKAPKQPQLPTQETDSTPEQETNLSTSATVAEKSSSTVSETVPPAPEKDTQKS
ncbi:Sec-independent protein translocase protein TatB [Thiomicrorhabdus hydrogeniphila]